MRVKRLKKDRDKQKDITLKDLEPGTVFCFVPNDVQDDDTLYIKLQCYAESNIEDDIEEETPKNLILPLTKLKDVIGVVDIVSGLFAYTVEEAIVFPQDGYYVIPPR